MTIIDSADVVFYRYNGRWMMRRKGTGAVDDTYPDMDAWVRAHLEQADRLAQDQGH